MKTAPALPANREIIISEMLHALELSETTFNVSSETRALPGWFKLRMREERDRVRKIIKKATTVGILE